MKTSILLMKGVKTVMHHVRETCTISIWFYSEDVRNNPGLRAD